MEFERKELEEIKLCLEDRATKVNEELKNLKLANWETLVVCKICMQIRKHLKSIEILQ